MVNTHKLQEGDIVMITTAECGATGVFRKQDIDYLSSAYGVRIRLRNMLTLITLGISFRHGMQKEKLIVTFERLQLQICLVLIF